MMAVAFLFAALGLTIAVLFRAPAPIMVISVGTFAVVSYQLFTHLGDGTTWQSIGAGVGAVAATTTVTMSAQSRREAV